MRSGVRSLSIALTAEKYLRAGSIAASQLAVATYRGAGPGTGARSRWLVGDRVIAK